MHQNTWVCWRMRNCCAKFQLPFSLAAGGMDAEGHLTGCSAWYKREHSNNQIGGSSSYEVGEWAVELFPSKAARLSFSTFFFLLWDTHWKVGQEIRICSRKCSKLCSIRPQKDPITPVYPRLVSELAPVVPWYPVFLPSLLEFSWKITEGCASCPPAALLGAGWRGVTCSFIPRGLQLSLYLCHRLGWGSGTSLD